MEWEQEQARAAKLVATCDTLAAIVARVGAELVSELERVGRTLIDLVEATHGRG